MSDDGHLAVSIRNVHKCYGHVPVLKGVCLDIAPGEVVALIGPSGAGKSTLLRCVNHLEVIDQGQIYVHDMLMGYELHGDVMLELGDRRASAQRRTVGMVFQGFNLFHHMTAIDNVASGLRYVTRISKAEALKEAQNLLASVGLADKAKSYPSELSGGQQQRVAIARTLAMRPKVLLLDEPTSALDPTLAASVIQTIKELKGGERTILIATHEMALVREFADRVVLMINGEIVETAATETFFTAPQDHRTKQFLSRSLVAQTA